LQAFYVQRGYLIRTVTETDRQSGWDDCFI